MTSRDHFLEVFAAQRQAFERAAAAGLKQRQWKVLGAVCGEVSTWSRLQDRVYLYRVAELAHLNIRDAAKALKELAALGIIVYEPGSGRPSADDPRRNRSLVGLPAAGDEGRYRRVEKAGDGARPSGPEKAGGLDVKGGRFGPEKAGGLDVKGGRSGPKKAGDGAPPPDKGPTRPFDDDDDGAETDPELVEIRAWCGVLTRPQRATFKTAWTTNPAAVRLARDQAPRQRDVRNPVALFLSWLEDGTYLTLRPAEPPPEPPSCEHCGFGFGGHAPDCPQAPRQDPRRAGVCPNPDCGLGGGRHVEGCECAVASLNGDGQLPEREQAIRDHQQAAPIEEEGA